MWFCLGTILVTRITQPHPNLLMKSQWPRVPVLMSHTCDHRLFVYFPNLNTYICNNIEVQRSCISRVHIYVLNPQLNCQR